MVTVEFTISQGIHTLAALTDAERAAPNAVVAEAAETLLAALRENYTDDPPAWDAMYDELDLLQTFPEGLFDVDDV